MPTGNNTNTLIRKYQQNEVTLLNEQKSILQLLVTRRAELLDELVAIKNFQRSLNK